MKETKPYDCLLYTSAKYFPASSKEKMLELVGNLQKALSERIAGLELSLIHICFILQKKMADTHPLITIFGVIIGLSLFGFMGIIFGPLLISVFILCFSMFKKEYLDK